VERYRVAALLASWRPRSVERALETSTETRCIVGGYTHGLVQTVTEVIDRAAEVTHQPSHLAAPSFGRNLPMNYEPCASLVITRTGLFSDATVSAVSDRTRIREGKIANSSEQ